MRVLRWLTALVLLAPLPLAAQEVTFGSMLYLADRTTSFNGQVGTGSTSMLGLELEVRTRYVGVLVKAWGGNFDADSTLSGAGKVNLGELRIMGGPHIISGTVGYGRRTLDGAITARSWTFVRLGAASQWEFGGSGFSGEIDAGYYTGVGGNGTFDKGSGADVETRLTWQPRKLPVYIAIGYRRERFVVQENDANRPDILSSVLVAAGISFGRQR